jgi:predicted  nucleic acid-binding Zn-ribbon protein
METFESNLLIEEIRAERKRIEEKSAEIHAIMLQLQSEALDLQKKCPHDSMVIKSDYWDDAIFQCPDCGYEG